MSKWTDKEKGLLLQALKKYGPSQIVTITNEIPSKTTNDITTIIAKYQRLAQRKDKELFDMDTPIDKWTNLIKKYSQYNILSPIARAFKYIMLFEKRDELDIDEEGDVNIRDCYALLSNLSEGVVPKELDAVTAAFMMKILKDTAKQVKKDKDKGEAVKFLTNFSATPLRVSKTYSKRKRTDEEVEDSVLNPLKVPKGLYKKPRKATYVYV